MAVFIRTDMPVAPGTATLTTTSANSGTGYANPTMYYYSITIYPGTYGTVLTANISLTKRSIVIAVVFGVVYDDSYATHELYIAGTRVSYVSGGGTRLLDLEGYQVLPPGSYTIDYKVYVSSVAPAPRTYYYYTGASGITAVKMVIYIVPLE